MPKFLSEEQVKFYKDNGFIKLENIFSKQEFDKFSDEYDDLFRAKKNDQLEAVWQGNDMKELAKNKPVTVLSIHNLQFHSAAFTRVLMNDRLLDALEDIMGTPNVLLHHTKAHLKPPEKGAPYLMHQDYPYFPFEKHSMVAVFIHMDDTSPENGGLAVYPGSHKLGPLESHTVSKDGEDYHYVDKDKWPLSGATPVLAKRGEVVVFSYLLLHGSYLNTSKDRVRRMFLIQLMSAEDEPAEDKHRSYGQGMVLRGRNSKWDASLRGRFMK
ncbi:probable alpha-ketoglutarate-dependent hypophosphite dioxygenase [Bacillus rossius redtenbacheri]|uniref:probable alpha-ketoglutarate-dependent hypophosphite dioxygenase n=1 Tax=Bacillus rossius redtenbacheri TaxID=93214 RepID=UPI002FDD1184